MPKKITSNTKPSQNPLNWAVSIKSPSNAVEVNKKIKLCPVFIAWESSGLWREKDASSLKEKFAFEWEDIESREKNKSQNFEKAYSSAGFKRVKLKVKDIQGNSTSTELEFLVFDPKKLPSVKITKPNGQVFFNDGQKAKIEWEKKNVPENFKLEIRISFEIPPDPGPPDQDSYFGCFRTLLRQELKNTDSAHVWKVAKPYLKNIGPIEKGKYSLAVRYYYEEKTKPAPNAQQIDLGNYTVYYRKSGRFEEVEDSIQFNIS